MPEYLISYEPIEDANKLNGNCHFHAIVKAPGAHEAKKIAEITIGKEYRITDISSLSVIPRI